MLTVTCTSQHTQSFNQTLTKDSLSGPTFNSATCFLLLSIRFCIHRRSPTEHGSINNGQSLHYSMSPVLDELAVVQRNKKNQTPVLSTNRTPGKSQDKWDPIVLPFPYIVLVYRPVLPAKAYKRFYISVDATRGSRDPGATKIGSSENRDYKTSPSCYSLSIICSC